MFDSILYLHFLMQDPRFGRNKKVFLCGRGWLRYAILFERINAIVLILTPQKMKFSPKDFVSKYEQIGNFLWIS